jgi:nonsense-mediated mRNA decay protein 3
MPTEEFCVVCGRTGRALTDGVCADCAAERTVLVSAPKRGEVVLCPTCGARRVGARWERSGAPSILTAEDLAPFLEIHPEAGVREIRWEEVEAGSTVREMLGRARVVFRGVERWVEVPLTVRMVAHTCTDCGRRSGHYYTALVQLRGAGGSRTKRPKELKERLAERWDALLAESRADVRRAVSWSEELPEGWDVYFSDTLAARGMARLAKQRYGIKISESASLFGRKNGKDVYRVTFCLRFADLSGPRGRSVGARAPVEP